MVKKTTQLVRPNFNVKLAQQGLSLTEHIISEVGQLPNLVDLKYDPSFIQYICDKIENEITAHKNQQNNSSLLLKSNTTSNNIIQYYLENPKIIIFWQIYNKIYGDISNQDQAIINAIIDFLIKNKLVKKVSIIQIWVKYFRQQYVCKKCYNKCKRNCFSFCIKLNQSK